MILMQFPGGTESAIRHALLDMMLLRINRYDGITGSCYEKQ